MSRAPGLAGLAWKAGLTLYLRLRGTYSAFYRDSFCDDVLGGKFGPREVTRALRMGFEPSVMRLLRVDSGQGGRYLSNEEYYAGHPYNGAYSSWIDDKLTLRYVLSKYAEVFPGHYASFSNGTMRRLPDWPDEVPFSASIGSISELLAFEGALAVKRLGGCGGEGFAAVRFDGKSGCALVNGKRVSLKGLGAELESLGGSCIVTAYVEQCRRYAEVWPSAAHCIRIQTVKEGGAPSRPLFNFIRWGCEGQRYATGHTAGGAVFSCADFEGGFVERAYQFDGVAVRELSRHPDTGVDLVGEVPNWRLMVDKCLEMHDYLSELSYVGWDVVSTDDGFRVLEANSLSALAPVQLFEPVMETGRLREWFASRCGRKRGGAGGRCQAYN